MHNIISDAYKEYSLKRCLEDPFKMLADAIIYQALDDVAYSVEKLKSMTSDKNKYVKMIKECKEFFNSDYCIYILYEMDPNMEILVKKSGILDILESY